MNNQKKIILMVTFLVVIATLLTGSTFAYLQWRNANEDATNVVFTTGKGFSCSATGGGDITSNEIELVPSLCTNSGYAIKREIVTTIVNTRDTPVYLDLWLDIKNITSGLASTENFRYALTDSSEGCTSGNVILFGSFNGKNIDDKVHILINALGGPGTVARPNARSVTYYLYIWLDAEEEEDFTQDQSFHFELGGECSDNSYVIPNEPELVDNLIPVILSDSGDTVKAISANNPNWYDYNKKKWANAVLVNSTHRSNYQNLSTNQEVTIPGEEILAYYVWIPRYSYQVWAYSGSDSAGDPHTIPIKFIDTNTIDTASKIGDWYTHPAFWWDNDSDGVREDGEELSGIWVGKFEPHHTSYTTTTSSSLGCSSTSCVSSKYNNLRILPNVKPLTNNNLSNFFFASRAMETSGNDFGINPSTTDTHMMKNSEWGALAYLSHSKYGIDYEIRINNTYNVTYKGSQRRHLTGCGAGAYNEESEAACDIQYGLVSSGIYPQSTTGNVTGVFDISGGTLEFVMGTLNVNSLVYNYSNRHGFNSSTNPLPVTKYYDQYSNSIGQTMGGCTLVICGGHALNEVAHWYGDRANFINNSSPWLYRGGYYSMGPSALAGAFYIGDSLGYANNDYSTRFVLIANEEK